MFPGHRYTEARRPPPHTQPGEAVHGRKLQGTFRNLETKLGVNNHPEPALSLQLQLPVKIRKFKFLIRSLLRLVSFGQESALQGGSCLKVNLTHCWKPQLHVQPLLLPAFSSPSTAWRPVIPPPPFEGLNSKQI